MIRILARIFIKDFKNYSDATVRSHYGILCGAVGIFFNFVLFLAKLLSGIFFRSVAVTADAFNNLSDATSSLIQLLAFKLSLKQADAEHPFGHARIEYVAGLIVSFIILLMGFELLKTSAISIWKIFSSDFVLVFEKNLSLGFQDIVLILILISTILVKAYMFFYNFSVAKKINSVAMKSIAKDSLSDSFSTFVVILSVLFGKLTSFPADGFAGCLVSCLILYTGFDCARDTIAQILGTATTSDVSESIEEELLKHSPIMAMHDLIVHDYGAGHRMISLHAEVPGDRNIFELHDAIDEAEVAIAKKFDCSVVIHMDPIDVNDSLLAQIKPFLSELASKINSELNVHDVRLIHGKKRNTLVFDVVKPFALLMSDAELKKKMISLIRKQYPLMRCIINVDSPFFV